MADPRDKLNVPLVPDLEIPPPRSSPMTAAAPAASSSKKPPPAVVDLGGFGEFDLAAAASASVPPLSPPTTSSSSPSTLRSGHHPAAAPAPPPLDLGDDFDMEIERGAALVAAPTAMSAGRPVPASSRRPGGVVTSSSSSSSGSGLDIAYRRESARSEAAYDEPSFAQKLVANIVAGIGFAGALVALVKFVHRQGGRPVTSLLPHAFDATSPMQSGIFSLVTLATAIGLGFAGLKMAPRSLTIAGSGGSLLISALAMVTVTLVATDDHPLPPDGALLIPYLVPLALLLLGVGTERRAVLLFFDGGFRRVGTLFLGAFGAVFVFAAIELSGLAKLVPVM